jgi:hypothetical protein
MDLTPGMVLTAPDWVGPLTVKDPPAADADPAVGEVAVVVECRITFPAFMAADLPAVVGAARAVYLCGWPHWYMLWFRADADVAALTPADTDPAGGGR